MLNIFQIALYFLNKDVEMTSKKLQKLCWYAYSWFIASVNEKSDERYDKLFEDKAEAWAHGPVFNELYAEVKYNNKAKIFEANEIEDKEIITFLDEIYKVYGDFTGDELESITHQEKPWINARNGLKPYERSNNLIKDEDIFEEYLGR